MNGKMLDTPLRTVGLAPFKLGMRTLASSVTVIAVQGLDGASAGLTATAVCSLSAEPPTLLVCVNRKAGIAAALRKGAEFSVNVLAAGQTDIAEAFGGRKAVRGGAKFAFGSWSRSEHDVPILAGARASFECRVAEVMDHGTHHIVIGHVGDVHLAQTPSRGLVYADGAYIDLT